MKPYISGVLFIGSDSLEISCKRRLSRPYDGSPPAGALTQFVRILTFFVMAYTILHIDSFKYIIFSIY
jgi:hypothetical protein